MIISEVCKTCEFNNDGICVSEGIYKYGEKISIETIECDAWSISYEYYSEVVNNAPWYIRIPYNLCKITYDEFIDQVKKDAKGVGIEINIYDAIEKVYNLSHWELSGILEVSSSVISRARTRGTIERRKQQFSLCLHIPEHFFDAFTSNQINELEKCKKEFYSSYDKGVIEKLKSNGIEAMLEKLE